ncbi:MAG: tRNA pseudouridine(55) synthase TruB [Gammaproteobacteria bacterium 13_2_20CM_66_19]|nr:MAG: tRNA pseudouridine(55) synthase TruB [Gammaproteobacteria bacterium 13_2_20CM_66_19]TLY83177.1 MAG: tRNA pseudouridine(55) synthase TruB [Gammaproteobacteria bacterium]TLY87922.1 MAG: tRNA pseudouridine(55) synthase TruB [Gammaproteobacteria bacterium]TLZ03911.1 MAG: tRNA pseudouridine(55) synthase TruB [Gammaproteobacteria bacterium]TLZ08046.1 MAG: tRNA pseudouridine(55) synthase TruB [Gammaproteobacteria bacterium]
MPSGILLLDKPRGLTSNAALQRVRALLSRPKAGHVGSLDPLATGMLPLCLGEATKIAGEILAARKRYRFTLSLGERTATGDAEGAVTASAPVPPLERGAVEAVLAQFRGRQKQTPPMYSALKRAGQPLYRLARSGVTVERAAREVELFELELLRLETAGLELEILCSKGTYVRALAEDLAQALGTCGHVSALRRLYVEPFAAEPMQTLESLAEVRARGAWPALLPPDWPLAHLAAVRLEADEARRLLQGQSVPAQVPEAPARVRLYDDSGVFLGLGEADGRAVRPRRLLNPGI